MANYFCMFCTVKPTAPFVTFNGMLTHIAAMHPDKARAVLGAASSLETRWDNLP